MQRCVCAVYLSLACLIGLVFPACSEEPVPLRDAIPVLDARLENAHRLTDKVLTGAEPHGEQAFQALKDLGVKTVISVDGASPDVETARKFGLRYVHLPIGYDGVPVERGKELAKAITELDGPIYVHCHHGKHRGPAAAVVACVVAHALTNDEAIAAMKTLGTGENYLGLWQSARTAKPAGAEELKNLKVEYRSISPIPPLAEAMVKVDETVELLSKCQQAGWKQPKNNPDLDPAHEALKLSEIFTEIARTNEHKQRPENYKGWMSESAEIAKVLETRLRDFNENKPEITPGKIDAIYASLQNNCKACHKSYRNTKLK